AIASTVIERDAEPVLVAPTGLGGIISGNSESEAPQNTLRSLTGDESDTDDNDDNDDDDEADGDDDGSGSNIFGSDDDDD
ncbi:MAG: hypothetical protein AAFN11_17145, partial [Chloroflexota bacterium]